MDTALFKKPVALAVGCLMLVGAGCASSPDRPEQQLARAETSVEFAQQSDAQQYGPAALDRARNHLQSAQRLAESGDYLEALRAAEKAELDAELAAAQASSGKAAEALREIKESIELLRREIARKDWS